VAGLTVVWHHGTPQTGAVLPPLLEAARAHGLRLVSCARPSYEGSTPNPGRTVGAAARDVLDAMAALGVERFATVGASGGGPHALACAAQAPDRVTAVATLAGIAPYSDAFDWFGGMAAPGALRAALGGREARALYAETAEFDPASFIAADWRMLEGPWSSLGRDSMRAEQQGHDGEIDDDVAFAGPWAVDLGSIRVPVLLVQGGSDRVVPRAHADRLAAMVPHAELWIRPRDGHVSVLGVLPVAMEWLRLAATSSPG